MSTAIRVAVMAAIVATLVYLPLGLIVAVGAWLCGVAPLALLTFGGAMHEALGLLVWWLFAFAGASGYALWAFPWADNVLAWNDDEK